MATLYSIDGSTTKIAPNNGTDFTLTELRRMLNVSWVEVLRLKGADGDEHARILIVDEEGKLATNPVINAAATELYQRETGSADVIVGNAILTTTEFLN